MRQLGLMGWIVCIVCMVAGCGSGGLSVKTADASGKVTLDGKPVEGLTVYFVGPGHTGTGVTRADGSYELVTGGQVGENLVYFRPATKEGASVEEGMDEYQLQMEAEAKGGSTPPAGPKLPEQFTSAEKSPLTFNIPEGGTDSANFKLSSS